MKLYWPKFISYKNSCYIKEVYIYEMAIKLRAVEMTTNNNCKYSCVYIGTI